MEASRLNSFASDVAVALHSATAGARQRAAEFAAKWAVEQTGLSHPSLTAGTAKDAATVAAALDEQYFALSEQRETGGVTAEQVAVAFEQARAASAVEFVRRGEPVEAVYEAAAAVEDWSVLRAELLSLLST